MEQSLFLLIAAVIPLLFGVVMMSVPDKRLYNSLTKVANLQTRSVTQWTGFGIFTIGLIPFLARNDAGSAAPRAIITGNIGFYFLGLCFDIYHYRIGVMKLSGLITALIPHTFLIAGFVYYLVKL